MLDYSLTSGEFLPVKNKNKIQFKPIKSDCSGLTPLFLGFDRFKADSEFMQKKVPIPNLTDLLLN